MKPIKLILLLLMAFPVLLDAVTPAALDLTCTQGIAFGPVVITCKDSGGNAVNLTGWQPYSQVRFKAGGTLVVDLAPTITNAVGGQITIPQISDATTATLKTGTFKWDLIIQDSTGAKRGPFVAGNFLIVAKVTVP